MGNTIEILIFRHGQTDWNKERRIQGHTNTDLNDAGRNEARVLRKTIEEFSPELIYSSDMNRAFETAEIASSSLSVEILKTPKLRECCFGVIEGKKVSEIIETYGADIWERHRKRSREDNNTSFYEGAETRADSLVRFLEVIDEILKSGKSRVAIATHGGVVRTLLSHYAGDVGTKFSIPNCVSYILNFQGGKFQKLEGPIEIDGKTLCMKSY